MVSIALEKQQVAVLAERVDELLDEVIAAAEASTTVVPAVAPFGLEDNDPLEQPIQEEFRAGTMTLSWDPEDERVVIEVYPDDFVEDEEDDEDEQEEPEELLVVHLPPAYARAFVKRAELVVGAGRPTCPFCGGPIDPAGHLCVRANGFKRRDPV